MAVDDAVAMVAYFGVRNGASSLGVVDIVRRVMWWEDIGCCADDWADSFGGHDA